MASVGLFACCGVALLFVVCSIDLAAAKQGQQQQQQQQVGITKTTIVPAPADCDLKVQNGDTVWIEHRGFWKEQQIDGNPEGEPLKFVVGKNRVIKGKKKKREKKQRIKE